MGVQHGRDPGRFDQLVAQVADYAIIALDPQGTIETWNLGAERVKQYTAEEAIGRSFAMFYTEDDRRAGLPLELLLKAREDGRVEHRGWRVRKDGTRFWGDVVITATHDPDGHLTGYLKVTRDLTEEHALELALRSSEERFRLLVGQVSDYAIIALDPQGVIETWNLGAERVKQYTADEAIGRSFAMFYTDEDRRTGLPLRLLSEAREHGRVEHTGWRVRKNGERFWADVVITALHDAEGNLTGFAKVTRDLTEQHALEEKLRASEERLRLLVGQVSDYAIVGLDPQGAIETWNLGAERVKGYTAEEAIGRSFAMFYTDADRRAGLPMKLLTSARETGRVEHTGWRVRKDGSRFWGDVVITALHDETGRLTGYAKVTRDRTDLKAIEDAQDAFYAAFNHDFRTPVTALKGFVDALRDAEVVDRDMLIDRVESSADRLLSMVEGLIQFATQRVGKASLLLADIDLAQVTRSAVRDLAPALEPGRVRIGDDVALAAANGVAMHRVITNLVVNALKYSPSDTPVDVTFGRTAPGLTTLTITDRGRGIHPDDIETIFEEFARGRLAEQDGGTGLGLTSARDLVDQQNGTLTITSDVGVGTVVTVALPSISANRPDAPTQRSSSDDVPDVAGVPGVPEVAEASEVQPTGHCSG
ncbi:MAG: PAS domain-containing sensor histidine kinase [Marmoricola sp.]